MKTEEKKKYIIVKKNTREFIASVEALSESLAISELATVRAKQESRGEVNMDTKKRIEEAMNNSYDALEANNN